MSKTHYATVDKANESNNHDEWHTTLCGLEETESPLSDRIEYVSCKKCLKIYKKMKEDRSKFYNKPMKFGAQTLYDSDLLDKISNGHWEKFHVNSQSKEGFKIGDFIDFAVDVTAIQLVEFLDEFSKLDSIDEVKKKCKEYVEEIQKEVNLGE